MYTHVVHMVDFRIVRVQIQDSVPSRRGHLPDHPAHSGLWPAGDLKTLQGFTIYYCTIYKVHHSLHKSVNLFGSLASPSHIIPWVLSQDCSSDFQKAPEIQLECHINVPM